jgi:hypothetical protein
MHSLFIAFIAIIAIISTRCHNRQNGLKGALPEAIGNLTKLSVLNLNGGRPDNYMGCSGTLGTLDCAAVVEGVRQRCPRLP